MSERAGTLYWITGLSGAGKTTIGERLFRELRKTKEGVVFLDGDVLKEILGRGLGFDRAARMDKASRYAALCKALVEQGIDVVISTISMYDSVRDANRAQIGNYVEIFLDVDMETLRRRNTKGLYSPDAHGENVVGVDLDAEFPKTPDLTFQNDGRFAVDEIVAEILGYIKTARGRS